MPGWDDPRARPPYGDRDRWRSDPGRGRGPSRETERRAFDERGGYGARAWDDPRSDRYPSRYDLEGAGYAGPEDAGSAGYAHRHDVQDDARRYGRPKTSGAPAADPSLYGGQEYGLEPHSDGGPDWGFDRGPDRNSLFDRDDPGVGQIQAGYAFQARSHPDQDFDPDYVRWRDEQLRAHDREYAEWRRHQHEQYDTQYRNYRRERQRHFGQAFHEWRSQRSAVGGVPDNTVAPWVSGYGDKTAIPGGYNAPGAYGRPTGEPDPPGHLSSDLAMRQAGGIQEPGDRPAQAGGPSEFGREPPQVQASAGGLKQGQEPKDAKPDDPR